MVEVTSSAIGGGSRNFMKYYILQGLINEQSGAGDYNLEGEFSNLKEATKCFHTIRKDTKNWCHIYGKHTVLHTELWRAEPTEDGDTLLKDCEIKLK
jgi:hypothetical protein